jgi:hypothetical protein
MQIQKSPFPIDFLRNDPEFIIRTSPDMVEERKLELYWKVGVLHPGNIDIETPHGNWTYTVKETADPEKEWEIQQQNGLQALLASLEEKLVHNAQINKHYTVKAYMSGIYIRLHVAAREGLTGDYVRITSSNANDIELLDIIGTRNGRTRKPKKDYRIMAQYLLGDGTVTPAMHLDDNEGTVKVGTSFLAAWLGKPNIPRADETFDNTTKCGNQTLETKLLYAEVTEGITGLVKISSPVTLLNAKVNEADFLNNTPDWQRLGNSKMWQERHADIYGQDKNAIVRTDLETEQYLYIINTKDNEDYIERHVDAKTEEGTELESITIRERIAKGVNRIPCGWEAVSGLSGIAENRNKPVWWRIQIDTSNGKIVRTFVTRPRPYGAVTALLLNRCRLYESMVFEELAEETQTEGETAETSSGTEYMSHSRKDTVTLRTGKRTAKEIALLKDALEQPDNLLLDKDGRHAWRITFAPDTLKLQDSGQDLVDAEVKAMRTERIDRLHNEYDAYTPIENIEYIQEASTTLGR